MLLIFERFKGLSKAEIKRRLDKQYKIEGKKELSQDSLYEWYRVYKENDRKARQLTKDW